ncbi:MAG: hypothetical protein AAF639_16395, partial [Chloroflexota bacterium]
PSVPLLSVFYNVGGFPTSKPPLRLSLIALTFSLAFFANIMFYEKALLAHRQQVLNEAYHKHPERFVHGQPQLRPLPERVGINLLPSAQ